MIRAVTSASNLDRRRLCPGSEALERGIPEVESEDAKEGQFLHALDAHPEYDREVLKPELRDLLRISAELDRTVFDRVLEQFRILVGEPFQEGREHELFIEGSGVSIPGHCDRWRYWPSHKVMAIVDKKYGRKVVSPAAANIQLRHYAVGAANERDCEHVVVAISQPRLSFYERITMAAYTRADIELARLEILSIAHGAKREDAPLVAGEEQCRYCKAKIVCKKYAEAFEPFSLPGREFSLALQGQWSKAKILEQIHGLVPQKIVGLLNAISFSDMIKDEVRDVAREMVTEGILTDYELGKPGSIREIADPKRAMSLLELRGELTRDEILDCAKLFIGKIEERLREKKKLTAKQARELVEETLSSVIERSEKKPALVRVKKALTQ